MVTISTTIAVYEIAIWGFWIAFGAYFGWWVASTINAMLLKLFQLESLKWK